MYFNILLLKKKSKNEGPLNIETKIWNKNSLNLLRNHYFDVLEVRNEGRLGNFCPSSNVNVSAPGDSLIVRDTLSTFGLLFFLDSTLKYFPRGVMRVVVLFKAIFLSVQARVSSDI